MVLLISDNENMVGGDLEIAPPKRGEFQQMLSALQGSTYDPPAQDCTRVRYAAPGFATFMLGSRIAHRVTPVTHAPHGDRMTLIQSLSPLDAFAEDSTNATSFRVQDPRHINDREIARHYAWRAKAKLDYLVKHSMTCDSDRVLDVMQQSISELKLASQLIKDEIHMALPYSTPDPELAHENEMAYSESQAAPLCQGM